MNVWAKLITAVRGSVNEAGEAIIDSQALRILDQEVRDASEELKRSKDSLASIIARQKLAEEKAKKLREDVTEHEDYAIKALEKNDATLAHDVAVKIADFETQLKTEEDAATGFEASANQLRSAVSEAERDIQSMKQQIDTVKATDNVQRAQAAISERHAGTASKLHTAMESLERIKEKQALRAAEMSAANELAGESSSKSLNTRLEDAGIKSKAASADQILERLKSKTNAT